MEVSIVSCIRPGFVSVEKGGDDHSLSYFNHGYPGAVRCFS